MTETFTIPYPKTAAGKKQWAKDYGLNKYILNGCDEK